MPTDIIETITASPVTVLIDEKAYSEFYERVKAHVSAFVPDTSTAKGRSEIASMAFKVTRSKTAIDAAGKKLNEDARARINAVDAQRRKIREELDALADEVRRPLTEWEETEKARVAAAKVVRENIAGLGNSPHDATSGEIRDRLAELNAIEIDPEILREELDIAISTKSEAMSHLLAHLARAEKAEADAAELARLRAEAEAREAAERDRLERERLAKEAAEREARERAEYEASIKREAESAERAQREARAREEAAAQRARDEAERAAAERVAKAEAEAARVKAEAERAERERLDQIERTKREEAARQADRAHRSAVMKDAKEAIMSHGVDDDAAKKIVLAIVAGEIPHVTLRF